MGLARAIPWFSKFGGERASRRYGAMRCRGSGGSLIIRMCRPSVGRLEAHDLRRRDKYAICCIAMASDDDRISSS